MVRSNRRKGKKVTTAPIFRRLKAGERDELRLLPTLGDLPANSVSRARTTESASVDFNRIRIGERASPSCAPHRQVQGVRPCGSAAYFFEQRRLSRSARSAPRCQAAHLQLNVDSRLDFPVSRHEHAALRAAQSDTTLAAAKVITGRRTGPAQNARAVQRWRA